MPSAWTARARAMLSFTMNSALCERQKPAISLACARRSDSGMYLARYCTTCAPPRSAAFTFSNKLLESVTSGVIAYRPLTGLFILRLFLACPEQSIRNQLSHAGSVGVLQCLPGIFLCIADSLRNGKSVCYRRRDC